MGIQEQLRKMGLEPSPQAPSSKNTDNRSERDPEVHNSYKVVGTTCSHVSIASPFPRPQRFPHWITHWVATDFVRYFSFHYGEEKKKKLQIKE